MAQVAEFEHEAVSADEILVNEWRVEQLDLTSPKPDTDRERPAVPTFDAPSYARTLSLVSCSLCLRVLRDSDWVDARDAIRRLRNFELATVVHLEPGLCDQCADLIDSRRANAPLDRLPDAA